MSNNTRAKLEFVGIVFTVGMAWGTLTMQLRNISASMVVMEQRISNIEKYMIAESKGKFEP